MAKRKTKRRALGVTVGMPASKQGKVITKMSMACPVCDAEASEVVDSRPFPDRIKRRRVCPNDHRYSTTETVDPV